MALLSSLLAPHGLLVGTPATALKMRAPTSVMAEPPLFYSIFHEIKKGKEDEFWSMVADSDFAAMAKAQHEDGIFNHNFLPTEDGGPILCLWECKDDTTTPRQMQTFIDDLFGKQLKNTPYQLMPGAVVPASAWPKQPPAQVANPETTGDFFWVHHKFKSKESCETFWASMADVDMAELEKSVNKLGFHNHYFMPTGETPKDDVFCVWESKVPMTIEDFQAFIDGPNSPAAEPFMNTVYKVLPAGATPSAKFPPSWIDQTMKKIEEFGEEVLAKFEEVTAKSKA